MTQSIGDVMTPDPVAMPEDTPIIEAAKVMRDSDIGDVIVLSDGKVCGIVTDRDVVVRAVAAGRDPGTVRLGEICSHELVTVSPDDSVGEVIALMRERAIRRVPVVEADKPVGIVSLGDLAIERDSDSALSDISSAPPNN